MLKRYAIDGRVEAGCDEAGRGCLAGPVVAAAVVLPRNYSSDILNDSKQLSATQRQVLRDEIESMSLAWAVAIVDASVIDRINILHASTHAMCIAVNHLLGAMCDEEGCHVTAGGTELYSSLPQHLLVDGNRFYNETPLNYTCIVKGDATYMSIAAASILAKTHRDEIMEHLSNTYPLYGWTENKGYPTKFHYDAIEQHGITPLHRRSFTLYRQHSLFE